MIGDGDRRLVEMTGHAGELGVAVVAKALATLVDDLDGGAAAGSLSFGLDDQTYEIDLSVRNANALFEVFKPYLKAGRQMTHAERGVVGAVTDAAIDVDPSAVRAWAASNGIMVWQRGRISAAVIEQFRAAVHGSA
jgi:Lsr2